MFNAGQILTADDLNGLATTVVSQETDQLRTNSTTLLDTNLAVPVDGLTIIRCRARYISEGGGIRWAWRITQGSVTGSRTIWGPGQDTGGVVSGATTYLHRSIANLTFAIETNHFSGGSTNGFAEDLAVDGDGVLVLQFAQETADSDPTTFHASSWLEYFQAIDS